MARTVYSNNVCKQHNKKISLRSGVVLQQYKKRMATIEDRLYKWHTGFELTVKNK